MQPIYDLPPNSTRTEQAAYVIGQEEASYRAIRSAAAGFALSIAAFPDLWRTGDGQGGFVLACVTDALASEGFAIDGGVAAPSRITLLAARDGWRCHYCSAHLGWGDPALLEPPTIDHVIPKSKDGTNKLANLVLACRTCNSRKGTRSLRQWIDSPCCDRHRAEFE